MKKTPLMSRKKIKKSVYKLIRDKKTKKTLMSLRKRPFLINIGLNEKEYKSLKLICIDKKLKLRDILLSGIEINKK